MALNILNINLNKINDLLNFTFLIDIGKTLYYSNNIQNPEISLQNLKNSINDITIFKINSEVLNIQNNKNELISSLDCFYSPATEALCIIIEHNIRLKELSKEIITNLMDFASKISAKSLILLIDKKNLNYVKIIQSMMIIGFANDKKYKTAILMGKEYKLLRLDCIYEGIEEVTF